MSAEPQAAGRRKKKGRKKKVVLDEHFMTYQVLGEQLSPSVALAPFLTSVLTPSWALSGPERAAVELRGGAGRHICGAA